MTIFYPPYWSSFGDTYSIHKGSGTPRKTLWHYEDRSTGLLSTHNRNHLVDPGDSASHQTVAYSEMIFLFQMPSSGRLSVVCTLQPGELFHAGLLWNEWGWSEESIRQSAYFTISLPSDPGLAQDGIKYKMLDYPRVDDEGYWEQTITDPGELRLYQFVSQTQFAAGDWVTLYADIVTFQDVWLNDYDFLGEVRNSWTIKQIDVTSVR
jgi:hypothetical protein